MRSLEEIKDQLRILTGLVQSMRQGQGNIEAPSLPDEMRLPLETTEAVIQLEQLLQDAGQRRKLVSLSVLDPLSKLFNGVLVCHQCTQFLRLVF